MTEALLRTKLYVPPTRPNLVPRPRLTGKLDQALEMGCRLILISAPAGFGKTTLLSEWLSGFTESAGEKYQIRTPHSARRVPTQALIRLLQ